MVQRKIIILLASSSMLLAAGCPSKDSGLTESQVDQILETQSSIHQERAVLSQQRDQLEEDRRTWADRERNDPVIASAISGSALLLACCLPLIVIALLLWPRQSTDSEVCDVLIDDAASKEPKLLPRSERPQRLQ
jgi:hypothetical protein